MTSEHSDAAAQELDALATSVRSLLDEHAQVEQELADPQVHSSPGRARTLTRRYAELDRIAQVWSRLQRIADDLDAAHDMAEADPSFQEEADELFNCNNLNIRYWSWNYRGCWHQTCPPMDPR